MEAKKGRKISVKNAFNMNEKMRGRENDDEDDDF